MHVQIGRYMNDDDSENFERVEHVVIHPYDTWNMDHTVALVVLPLLKQLKETKHGAPFVDMPDRPDHLQCYKEPEDYETDKFHHQAWDWVMDEMIFAFETKCGALVDWEDEFFQNDGEISTIEFVGEGPAQLRLFPDEDGKMEDYEYYSMKKTDSKTKIDWDGRKAYQERITNGFRLFGKYYEGLWD